MKSTKRGLFNRTTTDDVALKSNSFERYIEKGNRNLSIRNSYTNPVPSPLNHNQSKESNKSWFDPPTTNRQIISDRFVPNVRGNKSIKYFVLKH